MRIALVTDVHLGPEATFRGELRKLGRYAEPLLKAFVEQMNQSTRPDLVINLGDVIEDETRQGDYALYSSFIDLLKPLHCQLTHVAGNHDLINLSAADLLRLWQRTGELHYAMSAGAFRLLVLSSRHEPGPAPTVSQDQLAWLSAELAQSTQPALIFVHHPLGEMDLADNPWFDGRPEYCLVSNRSEVREILRESRKVRAVFNGHVHWNHVFVEGGIPYLTLQSLTENVGSSSDPKPAAAHAVIDVDTSGLGVRVAGAERQRWQFAANNR